MLKFTIAAALLAAAASVAPAQNQSPYGFFRVKEGIWTIQGAGKTCTAFNRPSFEINVSPYNSISFERTAGEPGPTLRVAFWPGALPQSETTSLSFQVDAGKPIDIPARINDGLTMVTEPLSRETMAALRDGRFLTLKRYGTALTLSFSLDYWREAAIAFGECAAMLPR